MLIDEAHAQAAEAAKAASQAADVYINQGVLGATCIIFILLFLGACLVARGLYNDLKACNATALADRDKLILAQQAAAVAAEKGVAALESLKNTLETSKDASEDLTRQVELAAAETRHAIANIKSALDGIAGRMDRGRP
ncbi:hypothetical protein [Methylobacterium gnaphalii]|uniref:Uncharacterized protein n=1 Tax=Methylobacterium gnaphalii TaxID=1010610 RepID=A0A512JMA9_9HYPH|nr:hypothetical protein [Methylobacterium gnaphalii]GEP11105.1 hypothetical protein MGN01_29500 [Methylobacterium gnaphalii]GJD69895.1 hypothetical protein MMMDOFMJ_2834 [Methylobacterium gnaphalii]GLS50383.1 hypothetical protein GCM10007885_32350 [Methylobacterium gnaphalii]